MHLITTVLRTAAASILFFWAVCVSADEVDDRLQAIARTGPQGLGSAEAREAGVFLASQGPDVLPRLLVAMDTTNVVAANWYRTAFEEIVRKELDGRSPRLPLQFIRRYVRDPKRHGRVRRTLMDLLDRIEPDFRDRVVPTLLDDPEFRGEAVAAALLRGDAAKKNSDVPAARRAYDTAFAHARDSRQVIQSADRLKALGDQVSIIAHMGFVIDWYLLGPFDAPGMTGFGRKFPPETRVDLDVSYRGRKGAALRWKRYRTTDRLGQINLIQAIAPVKEAVGYAYAELISVRAQAVQIRCGADDNCTVWLNGEKIFTRLQWLNGTRLDRFTAPAKLVKGKNRLLVKICQGPQHKNPAVPNNWSLQLRFCSTDGAGIGLKSALPPLETSQSK